MAAISRLEPTLGPDHTGLVLFDTLNGYLHSGNPEKERFLAECNILENMTRLLEGARAAGLTTFYPMGAHAPGDVDTVARLTDTDMELRPLTDAAPTIKPGFHKDSTAAEIAPELAPADGDVMIPKHRWNSFFQTDLDFNLKVRGLDTIVIAGGSTDVGVASTLFAARDLDYGIVVVSDCCYSQRGNNNEFFLERVFPRMARVMTTDETVALMKQGAEKSNG